MDFKEFFETMIYKEATHDMDAKAQCKLANWMAHGYEIQHTRQTVTVIERKDDLLMIGRDGKIWKAVEAI